MAVAETITSSIDLMLANLQIVYLTVMTEVVLYTGLQFKGWWSKK